MNRNEMQKRFIGMQARLDEIGYLLGRARQFDVEQFEEYIQSVSRAAQLTESLACTMRGLVLSTTFRSKKLLMDDTARIHGITVERCPGWYKIEIPALLPGKKPGRSCAFIVDPLTYAMECFVRENKPDKMERCVFCFRHIYTAALPERAVRDHDNIEVKQVQDVIADKLIVDDTGRRCSNLYTSAMGERECTQIFVMLPEALPEWLENYPMEPPGFD